MSDTWGISGPLFIAFYLGVIAVVLIGTLLHRRSLFSGPASPDTSQLTPRQLAYLNGGGENAVASSLAWLHGHGTVSVDASGIASRTGGIPIGATSLDAAVMQESGTGLRVKSLQAAPRISAALDELRDGLTRDGLLVAPETRRSARTGTIILIGLILLGIWRAIDGSANGKPIGFLVAAIVGASIAAALLLLARPRRTRAGDKILGQVRQANAHLHTRNHPSWGTYGPDSSALAVGLYGGAVLWSIDPLLAGQTGLSRQAYPSTDSGASYVGGGDSGGSSGGGDGGGGGGCGGGGCGG